MKDLLLKIPKTLSQKSRGFTLVEIIISLAIFTVVAMVAIGALIKIIDANKKAQSVQNAITNLSFALESMSRELRVGSKYNCADDITPQNVEGSTLDTHACSFDTSPVGGRLLSFVSSEQALKPDGTPCDDVMPSRSYNVAYAYRFVSNNASDPQDVLYTLERARQKSGSGNACTNPVPIADSDFQQIISIGNVKITGYKMGVLYDSDHKYPLATIRVTGYAGVGTRDRTYFDVQTSASARTI